MDNIKNISLRLFFELSEHINTDDLFDLFSQYEPQYTVNFLNQKYGIILGIRNVDKSLSKKYDLQDQTIIRKYDYERIKLYLKAWFDDKKEIDKLICSYAIPLFFYIKSENDKALEWENKHLHFEPESAMISAGYKDFDQLGTFGSLDSLVCKYNIQPVYDNNGKLLRNAHDVVCDMPYHLVRMKLWKDLIEYNYNKNYQEIKSREHAAK